MESPLPLEARAQLAQALRRDVLDMVTRGKSGHIGSCFSIAEILATLYGGVLRVDPARPSWPDRDRFILSKGHATAILYSVLSRRGFFPRDWLEGFYRNDGKLWGHATHTGVPGVEVSTGSLGHGLPLGVGMALAAKRDGKAWRTFVVLSDGECDEGTTWESALFAGHHRLDNLVLIVDYNRIQSLGRTSEILDLDPLAQKFRDFGWAVRDVPGHDLAALDEALGRAPWEPGKPTCVVADTVKGKGVSFMEDKLLWHYRTPDEGELRAAIRELEASP